MSSDLSIILCSKSSVDTSTSRFFGGILHTFSMRFIQHGLFAKLVQWSSKFVWSRGSFFDALDRQSRMTIPITNVCTTPFAAVVCWESPTKRLVQNWFSFHYHLLQLFSFLLFTLRTQLSSNFVRSRSTFVFRKTFDFHFSANFKVEQKTWISAPRLISSTSVVTFSILFDKRMSCSARQWALSFVSCKADRYKQKKCSHWDPL